MCLAQAPLPLERLLQGLSERPVTLRRQGPDQQIDIGVSTAATILQGAEQNRLADAEVMEDCRRARADQRLAFLVHKCLALCLGPPPLLELVKAGFTHSSIVDQRSRLLLWRNFASLPRTWLQSLLPLGPACAIIRAIGLSASHHCSLGRCSLASIMRGNSSI